MPPSDGFRIANRVELRHQLHPGTMPVPKNAIATLRLDYYLPHIIDYLNFTGDVIHTRADYNYEWIFIRECVAVPIALQIRASLGQPIILPTGNMDLYRAAGRWNALAAEPHSAERGACCTGCCGGLPTAAKRPNTPAAGPPQDSQVDGYGWVPAADAPDHQRLPAPGQHNQQVVDVAYLFTHPRLCIGLQCFLFGLRRHIPLPNPTDSACPPPGLQQQPAEPRAGPDDDLIEHAIEVCHTHRRRCQLGRLGLSDTVREVEANMGHPQ
ncbi:unnamed protein product [Vitrella brassicaformis CCMP3155]|uniref:Uncharacterized protein n=1 Tax=Vitrella brassicaformis (strain CCMP3155) TaxID=1169540 RepID=A0A0G4E8E2_VITBC|nr:unnamed protein product [Vitrella brassicaformis CCMP3155]|eukprot:CEL91719.1 unnamed protein product [Vitrella brassicaformis CCMP3155]